MDGFFVSFDVFFGDGVNVGIDDGFHECFAGLVDGCVNCFFVGFDVGFVNGFDEDLDVGFDGLVNGCVNGSS